jgi:predicted phage gp36 major capsid-like protein
LLAAIVRHGNLKYMANDRISSALQRIAAALDRIDAVAGTPPPSTASGGDAINDNSAAELAALAERHAKLREEATIALSALDAVITRAASSGGHN